MQDGNGNSLSINPVAINGNPILGSSEHFAPASSLNESRLELPNAFLERPSKTL
jgi:hypothetical protein